MVTETECDDILALNTSDRASGQLMTQGRSNNQTHTGMGRLLHVQAGLLQLVCTQHASSVDQTIVSVYYLLAEDFVFSCTRV
jgi:hypothetical protein